MGKITIAERLQLKVYLNKWVIEMRQFAEKKKVTIENDELIELAYESFGRKITKREITKIIKQ